MRFAPIILLMHFPATVWSVSCSYEDKDGTTLSECVAFEMDCGSAGETKASLLTTSNDFAPYPLVPSMDDLVFYKTFEYEFQFNDTEGTGGNGNLVLTSSLDGNVTGVCTEPSKVTWQLSTANSGAYLVCDGGAPPTACCSYIYCDDGGRYVDASTCASWANPVATVPEQGPVVWSFQIEQSKSNQTDCTSAGGKTYFFGPAFLGMNIAVALFFLV